MSQFYPASKNNKNPIEFVAKPDSNMVTLGNYKIPQSIVDNLPQVEFGMWRTHSPYGAIMNANVLFGGIGYSAETTLSVSSEPEHPDGIPAVLIPVFGLSSQSLLVSGGSGHVVGDIYFISNEDSTSPAMIGIEEVDNQGAIIRWVVIDSGANFSNDTVLNITLGISSQRAQEIIAPTIELIPDQFTIVNIILVDGGSGYMFWDETGDQMPIQRSVVASNIGDGEGFIGSIDQEARYSIDQTAYLSTKNNRSRQPYINKYGKLSFADTTLLNSINKTKYSITQPIITNEPIISTTLSNGIAKI